MRKNASNGNPDALPILTERPVPTMRICLLLALLLAAGCGTDGDRPASPDADTTAVAEDAPRLWRLVRDDERLATLEAALERTGLDETLRSSGPFTLFAPTNGAFDALPEGTLDSLDTEALTGLLAYHLVPERLSASDVATATSIPTAQGFDLAVTVADDGTVRVNDATVIQVDIEAANGVLHLINAVLMPPDEVEM